MTATVVPLVPGSTDTIRFFVTFRNPTDKIIYLATPATFEEQSESHQPIHFLILDDEGHLFRRETLSLVGLGMGRGAEDPVTELPAHDNVSFTLALTTSSRFFEYIFEPITAEPNRHPFHIDPAVSKSNGLLSHKADSRSHLPPGHYRLRLWYHCSPSEEDSFMEWAKYSHQTIGPLQIGNIYSNIVEFDVGG